MNNTKKTITDFKKIIDSGMKNGSVSLKLFPRETDPEKMIVVVNNLSGKIIFDKKTAAKQFNIKNYGDVITDIWKKYSNNNSKDYSFILLDHNEKQKNGDMISAFYLMVYGKGVKNVRKWWYE